jgi:hypothetical protein
MKVTRTHSGSMVKRTKNILFSKLDDEMVAIDGEAGYCYSLNEPAARAWELIGDPIAVEAVCAQLCREYSVDRETCERDVTELFQHLCEAGLVSVDNAT